MGNRRDLFMNLKNFMINNYYFKQIISKIFPKIEINRKINHKSGREINILRVLKSFPEGVNFLVVSSADDVKFVVKRDASAISVEKYPVRFSPQSFDLERFRRVCEDIFVGRRDVGVISGKPKRTESNHVAENGDASRRSLLLIFPSSPTAGAFGGSGQSGSVNTRLR